MTLTNPLATPQQREVEDRALALLRRPEIVRVREIVSMLWQNATAWPLRDQAERFSGMIDEYMFHHAMRAANGDANHPVAARFMAPPHHWFGRDVPGSRWAGDSPDFIYRTIPVSHSGHLEIRGTANCAEPPTVNYVLLSDNTAAPTNQVLLDSLDMDIAPDGSFTMTVDASPAEGRRNHIQTRPGADFIMIRDALGDWVNQSPNTLTLTRHDPDGDPKREEAMAQHLAKIALDGVYYAYYTTQSGSGQPPNAIRQPSSSAAFGGMATQWGVKGNLLLEDDEAFVVRTNAAGAGFRNIQLTDAFQISIDYWKRTSSFNMSQMEPDDDGSFTFVVASRDPGIHNWLDNGGLKRCLFGQRWQAFARGVEHAEPRTEVRVVRFDELERELGSGVKRIDAAGRKRQLDQRAAGFARRFVDS